MSRSTTYPDSIKASVLAKLMSPKGASMVELAKEFNIPSSTIHTWKQKMLKNPVIKVIPTPKRPHEKPEEEKFQAVLETIGKTESEQSIYCRRKGIHVSHLEMWKKQMLEGLKVVTVPKAEMKEANNKIKKLKSDLDRKDKALAEVSALLILKKKANLLWGVSEED